MQGRNCASLDTLFSLYPLSMELLTLDSVESGMGVLMLLILPTVLLSIASRAAEAECGGRQDGV